MINEIEIYQEERPWGNFKRFINNTPSTVKIITVNPDAQLSLQSHQKRSEFWKVIKGSGIFKVGESEIGVEVGAEQFVPIEAKHQIIAGSEGMEILEIGLGDFDENDIIRYEDKYGRI